MENKCNEWKCPYNKKGVCTTNTCVKEEELLDRLRKNK